MLKKYVPEFIKAPLRSRLHERRFMRSEAGQDLWVFGEVFNEQRNGFFLDIGAHDGVTISIHTFLKIGMTGEEYASRRQHATQNLVAAPRRKAPILPRSASQIEEMEKRSHRRIRDLENLL